MVYVAEQTEPARRRVALNVIKQLIELVIMSGRRDEHREKLKQLAPPPQMDLFG